VDITPVSEDLSLLGFMLCQWISSAQHFKELQCFHHHNQVVQAAWHACCIVTNGCRKLRSTMLVAASSDTTSIPRFITISNWFNITIPVFDVHCHFVACQSTLSEDFSKYD